VIEPNVELRALAGALGVTVPENVDELSVGANFIVFAIKPQVIRDVAATYSRFAGHVTFVSVAAGIGTGVPPV